MLPVEPSPQASPALADPAPANPAVDSLAERINLLVGFDTQVANLP